MPSVGNCFCTPPPNLRLYLPVSIFKKYKNVSLYLLKRPQTEVSVVVDSYLWWGQKILFIWRVVNLSERKVKLEEEEEEEEVKIAQECVEVKWKLMVETKVTPPLLVLQQKITLMVLSSTTRPGYELLPRLGPRWVCEKT